MTANEILEARLELGRLTGKTMSQQAFAELLGVSIMTVSRWERGVYTPSPLSIAAIERVVAKARSRNQARVNTARAVPA